MKKLILTTIACAFITSPALADDFATEQAKILGDIIAKMEQSKTDPAQIESLIAQRNCVEQTTTVEELRECVGTTIQEHKKVAAEK